jgi:hypothetical protein
MPHVAFRVSQQAYGKGVRVTALNVGGGKQARPAEAEERIIALESQYVQVYSPDVRS